MSERDVVIDGLEAVRNNLSEWDHPVNAAACIDAAIAEIASLRAVVERYKEAFTTKDGVVKLPGATVYVPEVTCSDGRWVPDVQESSADTYALHSQEDAASIGACYHDRELAVADSLREADVMNAQDQSDAAEAAREGE